MIFLFSVLIFQQIYCSLPRHSEEAHNHNYNTSKSPHTKKTQDKPTSSSHLKIHLVKKRICLSIRRCHSNYSYKLWTDNTARHGKMKAWDIKNKSRHVKQDIRHWTANLRMEKLHLSCCRTLPMQIPSPNWKHCNWIFTQFACLDKSDELSTLEKSLK